MTLMDWAIALVLNGAVILYGMSLARKTQSSSQWFLGGRALPWWGVGLSMFATNVDNADLVAVTGSTYNEGLHIISVYALGSAFGGILAAFCVVPAIYRLGFYTNAEYLEARFGTTTRVMSAVIQLQYRSSMLGLMIWSIYLLLTRLVELQPSAAWTLIVIIVVCAGIYTAWGGLTSVVWTDALQGLIMLIGASVLFGAMWQAVDGWDGMNRSLRAAGTVDGVDVKTLPHVSGFRGDSGQTSPLWIALGWTIIGCGYWTVNHTQTMRLMGVRSLWDMRMAAVLGVAASLPIMIACACLGVFGRAVPEFSSLASADELYPMMAARFLTAGWKGLVVAGIVAAAVSTFDSMGSALSAIFTRDIYARLIQREADDAHYVRVGRYATVGVLALGFLYLPFIIHQKNMLRAFTTLIPVFVTPLLTMYVLGVTTRVNRRSGLLGLIAGGTFGIISLIDREFAELSWWAPWLSDRWLALCWSVLTTAMTMFVATWLLGSESSATPNEFREHGWLDRSREQLPPLREHPFTQTIPTIANPWLWAFLLVAVSIWVVFGVFW